MPGWALVSSDSAGTAKFVVPTETVTISAPLAPGASISLRFLLGVQQPGKFRFYLNIEALP